MSASPLWCLEKITRATSLTGLLLLAGCLTFENPRPCQPETLSHLESLQVPSDQVRVITIRSQTRSGKGSTRVLGHSAWVRLKSCSGHLVIDMLAECQFTEAYTLGDCRVAQAPHRG